MSLHRISLPVAIVALIISIATSCIGIIPSCNRTEVIESSDSYKVYKINEFTELLVCGVEVFVAMDGYNGILRLEADPEIIDHIKIENKRGTLAINDRDNYAAKKEKAKARVIVSANDLDMVSAMAGATVVFDKPITAETFINDGMITIDSAAVASMR